jgi:hypothetical protein
MGYQDLLQKLKESVRSEADLQLWKGETGKILKEMKKDLEGLQLEDKHRQDVHALLEARFGESSILPTYNIAGSKPVQAEIDASLGVAVFGSYPRAAYNICVVPREKAIVIHCWKVPLEGNPRE